MRFVVCVKEDKVVTLAGACFFGEVTIISYLHQRGNAHLLEKKTPKPNLPARVAQSPKSTVSASAS